MSVNVPSGSQKPPLSSRETEFEKPRGVSRIEVRQGYSQVHVSQLPPPVMTERMRVLKAVDEAGISIDFLKLTPSGLSFLVSEDRTEAVERTLVGCGVNYDVRKARSIVLVHAVNIRDEEGLIAEVMSTAIASGTKVDHVGDMHDRLLMIVPTDQADHLVQQVRRRWSESL